MNTGADSAAARRSALTLHALDPADRQWVLDALPPAQRGVLDTMLAELQALGIPADPSLVAELAHPRPAAELLHPAPTFDPAQARLHQLGAGEVHALACALRCESPAVIARLLAVAHWPWREALLAELNLEPTGEIAEGTGAADASQTLPPGLRDALLQGAIELVECGAEHVERPAPSFTDSAMWGQRLRAKLATGRSVIGQVAALVVRSGNARATRPRARRTA